jgi:hypothetical protein
MPQNKDGVNALFDYSGGKVSAELVNQKFEVGSFGGSASVEKTNLEEGKNRSLNHRWRKASSRSVNLQKSQPPNKPGMGEIEILVFSTPLSETERRKFSISILLNIKLLCQVFNFFVFEIAEITGVEWL